MTKADVRLNQIVHTAVFSRPLLSLWGDGRQIMTGLYDAFHPLGANFNDIRAEGASPSDQVVVVPVGSFTVHRFRFDRLETTFSRFTAAEFKRIPEILEASISWIRGRVSEARVDAHKFVYWAHCELQGESTQAFLGRIGPSGPASAGVADGHGAIFYWKVAEKMWHTQLLVDKSLAVANGLFLMFSVNVTADKVNFADLAGHAQEYLVRVLGDLGLEFSEV